MTNEATATKNKHLRAADLYDALKALVETEGLVGRGFSQRLREAAELLREIDGE